MSTTIASLSDVQAHLGTYVAAAQATHERTTITKNGRPVAVLIGCDDFKSLLATIEVLSDPDALASVEESRIDYRHGFYHSHDEVWDSERSSSVADSEQRLIARVGRRAYDAGRAVIRAELLAHSDANVRERATHYE